MIATNAGERTPAEIRGLGILPTSTVIVATTASPVITSGVANLRLSLRARKSRPAKTPTRNSGKRAKGLKLRRFFQSSVVSPELVLEIPSGCRSTYRSDMEKLMKELAAIQSRSFRGLTSALH